MSAQRANNCEISRAMRLQQQQCHDASSRKNVCVCAAWSVKFNKHKSGGIKFMESASYIKPPDTHAVDTNVRKTHTVYTIIIIIMVVIHLLSVLARLMTPTYTGTFYVEWQYRTQRRRQQMLASKLEILYGGVEWQLKSNWSLFAYNDEYTADTSLICLSELPPTYIK